MAITTGWGSQWETIANAINDYYGGGVDGVQYQQVVNMLNSGNYTMEEMETILGNIPEFTRTYNSAGQLTGVSYNVATKSATSAAGSVAQQVNSNVANSTQTNFGNVQTITKDAQTGKVAIGNNLVKYKTGQLAPTTMKGIPISVLQGVLATSAGITAGKTVSQLAYDKGFNWLEWAGVDMESLNPATWATITEGDDSWQAKAFNMILGLDEYNNPQPYMTEDAFAYMVAYMGAIGAFDVSEQADYDDSSLPIAEQSLVDLPFKVLEPNSFSYYRISTGNRYSFSSTGTTKFVTYTNQDSESYFLATAKNRNDTYSRFENGSLLDTNTFESAAAYTFNGETVYFTVFGLTSDDVPSPLITNTVTNIDKSLTMSAWISQYGDITSGGGVEGIDDQEGATVFNGSGISDWTNIAAVLAALKAQFPNLWDERVEVSPDGDTTITYIPVGFPTGGTGQQPTTDGATQTDLAPDITGDGDNATDELIKTLIDAITHPQDKTSMESDTTNPTKPVNPNGGNTGTGNTPVIITPTGSASALWAIYNPSQAQLDSFGGWLWSPNFVDQLLKLFNDPMQAIIGLHKIFATPPTSGNANIVVGYLDSGVSAKKVSSQYTEVDCGTVKLSEYFGNVLDYTNTDVYLYLPFIGIVPLNVEDVTRANINVKYKVDVLTGACLASVNVTRDANAGGQLYVYSGNCAVQYPLSSGSYMGIVSGILGIAGSVAGTIASGGALLPMALGVGVSAMNNAKTRIEHSGSLSGNAGAMGIKKPYLIIRRPQTKIAENFQVFNGESNNIYTPLSSCTGYTRAKYVHLENIPATDNELTEIEELLKSGVIISGGSVPNV